jgi:hypothetical protein
MGASYHGNGTFCTVEKNSPHAVVSRKSVLNAEAASEDATGRSGGTAGEPVGVAFSLVYASSGSSEV